MRVVAGGIMPIPTTKPPARLDALVHIVETGGLGGLRRSTSDIEAPRVSRPTLLAQVYARRGELPQARARIGPILAVIAASTTKRPKDLGFPIFVLAEIDLAAGDPAAAAAGFARALELRDIRDGATHRELANATFGLVRARWAIGARDGLAERLAEADAHFAAIHDAAQRRVLAEWAREHLGG